MTGAARNHRRGLAPIPSRHPERAELAEEVRDEKFSALERVIHRADQMITLAEANKERDLAVAHQISLASGALKQLKAHTSPGFWIDRRFRSPLALILEHAGVGADVCIDFWAAIAPEELKVNTEERGPWRE